MKRKLMVQASVFKVNISPAFVIKKAPFETSIGARS